MLDEQIDQLDDGGVFRLLTAPWGDLNHGEKDQAREVAHRVGALLAKQRRVAYTQMNAEQRERLLYGPRQHLEYVVRGFGEIGEAERTAAASYWEQQCETGDVLRDPRFQRVQVTLMGELARAFTAVGMARQAIADVRAAAKSSWTVIDLLETWALAPVLESETGTRAIAVRDPHARLLVEEYSREQEASAANATGGVSPNQLLEALAGLDAQLFENEDEVAVERSEDHGTYIVAW